MDQAWLDSLSEDWVSQPRSGSPEPDLPSLSNGTSESSSARENASRIPKYNPQTKSWTNAPDNNPLNERSLNENNIPLSPKRNEPAKLRSEASLSPRGRKLSRPLSASSMQSVQYHTVQHKSLSASPTKSPHDTPEWKRRLLHGNVAYGERRDLFSTAGLESIFQPPPSGASPNKKPLNLGESSVMPSSPPVYRTASGNQRLDDSLLRSDDQGIPSMGPKYRLIDDFSEFSTNDISRGSDFRPSAVNTISPIKNHVPHSDPMSNTDNSSVKNGFLHPGRIFSGQSDSRNEGLSPIYLTRNATVAGQAGFTPLDISPTELQERLEKLKVDDTHADAMDESELTSETVHGDITTDTDDIRRNGRFVSFRRGGRSQEGSFQKRMLSPSSLLPIDESAVSLEDLSQVDEPNQLPRIRKTRASNDFLGPQADLQPRKDPMPQTSPTKSGSPLKLFGTHDTFTSRIVLRRLSQYEDRGSDYEGEVPPNTAHAMNESSTTRPKSEDQRQPEQHKAKRVSSFGAGDLDTFRFNEEISFASNPANEASLHIDLPVLDPTSQTTFRFRLDSSPTIKERGVTDDRKSGTETTEQAWNMQKKRPDTGLSATSTNLPSSQMLENLRTPRKTHGDAEGKRLLRSPLKDPTPKRRRTLHRVDASLLKSEESMKSSSSGSTRRPATSSSENRRNGYRHHDAFHVANPKIVAMRETLRPRTPTPSQRSSQQRDEAPFADTRPESVESAKSLQDKKIAMVQAELDSFDSDRPLGASQQSSDSRKPSVTTQDFLDEAKKIMAGIRGKARPRSGLTSLEESQLDIDGAESDMDEQFEDSFQESTQERFSRPPSREGAPVSRTPLTQQDPELLDHLRKYEEKSDMDGIVASSIKSIALAKEAIRKAKEVDRLMDETMSRSPTRTLDPLGGFESEPPNIRLSHNPDFQRKRKHSGSTEQADDDYRDNGGFSSQGSNASIPTGSSRGSDSRRVIAPHTVSHLIPEQLAGMVFDRERNIWHKKKSPSGEKNGQNFVPSSETEDDPFENIPDLSIDETQELMRLRAVANKQKEDARLAKYLDEEGQQDVTNEHTTIQEKTNYNVAIPATRPQSAPSKPVRRGSDDSLPEGKIRSVSVDTNNIRQPKDSQNANINQNTYSSYNSTKSNSQGISSFSVDENILHRESREKATPQRQRNVTITFSSPLEEAFEAPNYTDDDSSAKDDAYQSDYESFGEGITDSIAVRKRKTRDKNGLRTAFHSSNRKISVGGEQFMPRPISRIDEQDEDSLTKDAGEAKQNDDFLAAPSAVRQRESTVVFATPRPLHEIGNLSLTPLSEFTMHQADESFGLNVSYVAKGQKHVPDVSGKKTLSHTIKQLVQKLTEIEPYEPFWENMKRAVLSDRKLSSLHKLDEFCGNLEHLEVSNNQINQLNGAPSTLRHLTITHNHLSDLTAWGHLSNLQHVDVSNNEIESLSCFKNLIHLRSLKADNNKIMSMHGIGSLDGLSSLRLRGNPIEVLDFSGTKLAMLSELDLKNCQIKEIKDIGQLKKLTILSLDNNKLTNFLTSDLDLCWAEQLTLSGNSLESFNANQTPQLRLLYLDGNRINTITGLRSKKHLDSLSVRQQQPGTEMDTSFFKDAFEVRKLYLSGNRLGTWEPCNEFLNLQYLELANCGITSLPDDFGLMLPNLRFLNLNFNALKEFQFLLGIVRLQKLLIAGNRLSKVEKLTRTLTAFPYLNTVDFRNNYVNHGFYPIAAERQLIKDGGFEKNQLGVNDPYTLGNADPARDAQYTSCLDLATKMKRRVYEIMLFGNKNNPRLKTMDGLPVNRSILKLRDDVYDSLVEADILRDGGTSEAKNSHGKAVDNGPPATRADSSRMDTESPKHGKEQSPRKCDAGNMESGGPRHDKDASEKHTVKASDRGAMKPGCHEHVTRNHDKKATVEKAGEAATDGQGYWARTIQQFNAETEATEIKHAAIKLRTDTLFRKWHEDRRLKDLEQEQQEQAPKEHKKTDLSKYPWYQAYLLRTGQQDNSTKEDNPTSSREDLPRRSGPRPLFKFDQEENDTKESNSESSQADPPCHPGFRPFVKFRQEENRVKDTAETKSSRAGLSSSRFKFSQVENSMKETTSKSSQADVYRPLFSFNQEETVTTQEVESKSTRQGSSRRSRWEKPRKKVEFAGDDRWPAEDSFA